MTNRSPCRHCGKTPQRARAAGFCDLRCRMMHWLDVRGEDECWLWKGSLNTWGYGQLQYEQRNLSAHRASYEAFVGPITDGLHVLHKCDNKRCANPHHLFLGTGDENMADMVAKERQVRGERQCLAKLTEDKVRAIRKDSRGLRLVAKDYGVSIPTIDAVRKRRTWKHVA